MGKHQPHHTTALPPYNLIPTRPSSDVATVTHERHSRDHEGREAAKRTCLHGESDWNLRLSALSADEPERLVRFLTGALLSCGGWVLTRSTQLSAAELTFEFARASCIEIYAVLIAAGLELSRDSHLQLAELCHCTRNLIHTRAAHIVHIELAIYHSAAVPRRNEYAPALAA